MPHRHFNVSETLEKAQNQGSKSFLDKKAADWRWQMAGVVQPPTTSHPDEQKNDHVADDHMDALIINDREFD